MSDVCFGKLQKLSDAAPPIRKGSRGGGFRSCSIRQAVQMEYTAAFKVTVVPVCFIF